MGNCKDDKPTISDKGLNLDYCSVSCSELEGKKSEKNIDAVQNMHTKENSPSESVHHGTEDQSRDDGFRTNNCMELCNRNMKEKGIIESKYVMGNGIDSTFDSENEHFYSPNHSNKENIQEMTSQNSNDEDDEEEYFTRKKIISKLDFEDEEMQDDFHENNQTNKENIQLDMANGDNNESQWSEEIKSRLGSDEEGNNLEGINTGSEGNFNECKIRNDLSRLSKKKSKARIKKERLKIHSETHRFMREREISIPYHISKQRTLKEFLSRKKNRANVPLNTPSSKMIEIWKDIEENTKNAHVFFKSDSDSDSETCKNSENPKKKNDETNEDTSCENGNNSNNVNKVIDNNDDVEKLGKSKSICDEGTSNNGTAPDNVEESKSENNKDMEEEEEDKDLTINTNNNLGNNNSQLESLKCKDDESNEQGLTVKEISNEPEDNEREALQNMDESNEDEQMTRSRTLEWVKSIPIYEKYLKQNKKEMLLQKLNPNLLRITPKLSGDTDSVIDLEDVKNDIEIGAKNLKKRFLQNCIVPRQKTSQVQLTITNCEANDKGEISNVTTEKLIYNTTESFDNHALEKPGAKLQRFREELKKKIEEKWEEELKKKNLEFQSEAVEKKKNIDEDSVEEEEELLEDPDGSEGSESFGEEESEMEEDIEEKPESRAKRNEFVDSEAEESDCEDEESGNEAEDEVDYNNVDDDGEGDEVKGDECDKEAEKQCEISSKGSNSEHEFQESQSLLIPPYQPGGGMLNGGSELSQYDEDNSFPKNILSPALKLSLDLPPVAKRTNITSSQQTWDLDLELPIETTHANSFVPCFPENENFDLNDAYEFCSGKFPDAEESRRETPRPEDSGAAGDNASEFDFGSAPAGKPPGEGGSQMGEENEGNNKRKSRFKIESDDSGDEEDDAAAKDMEDITPKEMARGDPDDSDGESVNESKTRKHLRFSDEESEEDEEGGSGEEPEDEEEGEDDPDPDRVVEYDSEEDEIINPKEFFEKEAELSGSEWSGDEDERDLDNLEAEDGDEDKLDDKQVRSQLEKIHMRTLMDDDAREVRLLQELLFEDGDLFDDGPKREKNFRWKDLGNFFDDDGKSVEGSTPQDQEEMEEEEEERKIRHEKELFLLNLKSKREELGLDEDNEERRSLVKVRNVVVERSAKIVGKCEEKTIKIGDGDDIASKAPFALTNQRGSFLSRNEEFLSRLAKLTSSRNGNILGPKHSKNFVFVSKSPEKENPSSKENTHPKRKNHSPRGGNSKRPKLDGETTNANASVLDRLK